MCAIAGILDLQGDPVIYDQMLSTMARRGPDGSGYSENDNCVLLHARLAIIDPKGGSQPMNLEWEGEKYSIVYNGELYNTPELRQELSAMGHQLTGHSDTEILLHAYAQWKDACLEKLNGIFAFAVWEKKQKRLFLARDRIGVKPLFFSLHNNGLLFASEIKTILCYPAFSAQLDENGIAELILLGPGRTPGSGVLKGIEEIEPGCCGYYKQGRLKVWRYWKLTDREHTESFEETAEHIRWLLLDAIRRQTVSDFPIGTFLSGGLDSSLISAVCAEIQSKKGEKLHCFSLDYAGNDLYFQPGKFQPNSDTEFIHRMISKLDIHHHWTVLQTDALLHELETATDARDLPGMADVDFSLLAFCRQIRQHVKVALSGECADEIFGGYPWYRDPEVREKAGFPWAQTTEQRIQLLQPGILKEISPKEYVMDRYRQTCLESDILPDNSPQEKRMKEMINLNFRWFMQTLLDRKDRMSMYSGLEVRVPFCDYRIAEYLYSVPWEYKDYKGVEKGLLRHSMEGILPDEILWRKKSPYPKTHDPRYWTLVRQRMEQLLQYKNEPLFQLINPSAIQDLMEESSPWPWYGQLMKTPQTIAYLLQINYWLKAYHVSILS